MEGHCSTGQSPQWAVVRMEEEEEEEKEEVLPKKIFTQELEGTRRRGRPRKRWKEEVERDLQVLGVRRSEFYMPTFRNTVCSFFTPTCL